MQQFLQKLRILILICATTCFAGIIYQLINENRVNYKSLVVGLSYGLVFGLLELFLFPRAESKLRRWSFTKIIIVKTLVYTAVLYIMSFIVIAAVGYFEGRSFNELPAILSSLEQFIIVLFALIVYGLLVFFYQVNYLLGTGVLWKFVSGKYHRPREEERIFMFLDMKSSTTIAEQLGHVRFYKLLNELFHQISEPVLKTRAEIYQYVGDEVILTWEVKRGLENANCLRSFFMFKENLVQKGPDYEAEFGIRPQFKAGLHFGKVISAQIGDLKREIVYNGDVLNTTARIQSECNRYNRDFLVSGSLMEQLIKNDQYQWEKVDTVTLRGKETEVDLFSVTSDRDVH